MFISVRQIVQDFVHVACASFRHNRLRNAGQKDIKGRVIRWSKFHILNLYHMKILLETFYNIGKTFLKIGCAEMHKII